MDEFKEKTEMVDLLVTDIREKLGDDAAVISEQLLSLQTTIEEAATVHGATVEAKTKLEERNKELLNVNNNLFIRQSNTPIVRTEEEQHIEDDPLDAYISLKTSRK
jgi:molybdopterin converting factor small subunit